MCKYVWICVNQVILNWSTQTSEASFFGQWKILRQTSEPAFWNCFLNVGATSTVDLGSGMEQLRGTEPMVEPWITHGPYNISGKKKLYITHMLHMRTMVLEYAHQHLPKQFITQSCTYTSTMLRIWVTCKCHFTWSFQLLTHLVSFLLLSFYGMHPWGTISNKQDNLHEAFASLQTSGTMIFLEVSKFMGVSPSGYHPAILRLGCSLIKHPAIGVPPFMETSMWISTSLQGSWSPLAGAWEATIAAVLGGHE